MVKYFYWKGLWNTIYGESVQQTNDGGYIVCGTIDS